MRIAIIGAGNLGGALGRRWADRGHEVVYGVRDPSEGAAAVKGGLTHGARVASLADAAAGAAVVILATPAGAVADAVASLGAALGSAIVVDATNPVGPGLRLLTGPDGESQAERTQALLRTSAPGARVVKSFNQTGANVVADPSAFTPRPMMAVAGDDADARRVVMALAEDLGFEGVDAGALPRARELERLAMLWIALSANPAAGLGRDFAVALARR